MARSKIIFFKTYNHRWPSRALTEYQASTTPLLVPKEVFDAAVPKYARLATKADGDGTDRAAGSVAGPDSGEDGPRELGDGDGVLADRGRDGAAAGAED